MTNIGQIAGEIPGDTKHRIHTMELWYDETSGNFQVKGVPASMIVAYGMLEMARKSVDDIHTLSSRPRGVVPKSVIGPDGKPVAAN